MPNIQGQKQAEKENELIQETEKLNRIIEKQGTNQAFAILANNFHDEENIMFIMDRLHLPEAMDRKKEGNLLVKKNQVNIAMREIEMTILQDYIDKSKLIEATTKLANGFHDEKNIAWIMDKLSLPESMDHKKETDALIKENQTLRKQIIEKLNEEIKQKNLHTEEKVLKVLRRNIPVGFSDTKSITTIIDKLDLPEWINREEIKESLITKNQYFLATHKLTPMISSLCNKQSLDKVFQQLSLPKSLEKKLRDWAIPKVLNQHHLDIEQYQKNFEEQRKKEKRKRLKKETQIYIKKLKRQHPNEIETYLEKDPSAKQQVQNPFNNSKHPRKDDYQR